MFSSLFKSLVLCLAAFVPVQATFVQRCDSRLLDGRWDPIVNPGRVSFHAHVISGGNGFNFTMNYNDTQASTCGSCSIKEDMSAYWAPKMYYHAQNGSFISVPVGGDDNMGNMGGMAIYYLHTTGPNNDKIVPFPEGFQMLAGNPFKRQNSSDFAGQAVSHQCIGSDQTFSGFPPMNCPGGIRTQVKFPNCWNGEVDVPDHQSHVSYAANGTFDDGPCPSTHPKRIMTLFYEIIYQTNLFADMWYGDSQPFVLAPGDPTGYGMHGDFVNGWNTAALQKAIDNCADDCPDDTFTYWTPGEQQMCKLSSDINEPVVGVLDKLPGCNPLVTDFFAGVMNMKNCADKAQIDLSLGKKPDVNGWTSLGCASDFQSDGHIFSSDYFSSVGMTPGNCINYCSTHGHPYAGLEFGSECYCGDSMPSGRGPVASIYGNCNMACSGDGSQTCGGNQAMQIYQKPAATKMTRAKRHVEHLEEQRRRVAAPLLP